MAKSLELQPASLSSWENCHSPSGKEEESKRVERAEEKPEPLEGRGPELSLGEPEFSSKTEKVKLFNGHYIR